MTSLPGLLRNRRVIAATALVLLLVVLALWPRAVEVDVAPVARGALTETLDEEGRTRVRRRFVVSAPVSGRVPHIDLQPGDRVAAGQAVATILPAAPAPLDARSRAEAAAAVAAARSALERARAEEQRAGAAAELARAQLARYRALAAAGVASRETLEARESEARSGDEALRAASFAAATSAHQLDAARARLGPPAGAADGPLAIHAPAAGVVFRRFHESEALVPAGDPLLELGDPTDLEIVADYLSTDAVRIRAGAAVRVEHWGGAAPLAGRVRRVEPSGFTKLSALGVEEQRVNVVIDLVDPAVPALGDGYRVEVRVVIAERTDALKVPVAALFRQDGAWSVFAVDKRRARLRRVEPGLRNGLEAEVLAGLAEGDEVVVHPGDALSDGARLRPRTGS